MNIVETYAPALTHLHDQLREHDSVILAWSAGPQPGTKNPNLWGTDPYILLQVEEPYRRDGEPDVIVIRSETDCQIFSDDGETFQITFDRVLAYLAQLPRPIWSFAQY